MARPHYSVQLNSGNGFGSRQAVTPPTGYGAPDSFPRSIPTAACGSRTSTTTAAKTCSSCTERPRPACQLLRVDGHRLRQRTGQPGHRVRPEREGFNVPAAGLERQRNARPRQQRRRQALPCIQRLGGVPDRLTAIGEASYRGGWRSSTPRWPTAACTPQAAAVYPLAA